MQSKINPSPALIARADTPLDECIRMMNEHRVGSILVVSDEGQVDLIGIFTERDLLRKFEQIIRKKLWTHPIRESMTSPVSTLDVSQLSQAADFMLKNNFRHVPVTLTDSTQSRQILAGIISMRDLFKIYAQEQSGQASWLTRSSVGKFGSKNSTRNVSIFSKDSNFSAFLKKMFQDFALGQAKWFDFSNLATVRADVLILDLDGLEIPVWTQYLKKLNQDIAIKNVLVVFDPTLQSAEVSGILEKIGQSEKFSIFRKPIDILSFFERVNSLSIRG